MIRCFIKLRKHVNDKMIDTFAVLMHIATRECKKKTPRTKEKQNKTNKHHPQKSKNKYNPKTKQKTNKQTTPPRKNPIRPQNWTTADYNHN